MAGACVRYCSPFGDCICHCGPNAIQRASQIVDEFEQALHMLSARWGSRPPFMALANVFDGLPQACAKEQSDVKVAEYYRWRFDQVSPLFIAAVETRNFVSWCAKYARKKLAAMEAPGHTQPAQEMLQELSEVEPFRKMIEAIKAGTEPTAPEINPSMPALFRDEVPLCHGGDIMFRVFIDCGRRFYGSETCRLLRTLHDTCRSIVHNLVTLPDSPCPKVQIEEMLTSSVLLAEVYGGLADKLKSISDEAYELLYRQNSKCEKDRAKNKWTFAFLMDLGDQWDQGSHWVNLHDPSRPFRHSYMSKREFGREPREISVEVTRICLLVPPHVSATYPSRTPQVPFLRFTMQGAVITAKREAQSLLDQALKSLRKRQRLRPEMEALKKAMAKVDFMRERAKYIGKMARRLYIESYLRHIYWAGGCVRKRNSRSVYHPAITVKSQPPKLNFAQMGAEVLKKQEFHKAVCYAKEYLRKLRRTGQIAGRTKRRSHQPVKPEPPCSPAVAAPQGYDTETDSEDKKQEASPQLSITGALRTSPDSLSGDEALAAAVTAAAAAAVPEAAAAAVPEAEAAAAAVPEAEAVPEAAPEAVPEAAPARGLRQKRKAQLRDNLVTGATSTLAKAPAQPAKKAKAAPKPKASPAKKAAAPKAPQVQKPAVHRRSAPPPADHPSAPPPVPQRRSARHQKDAPKEEFVDLRTSSSSSGEAAAPQLPRCITHEDIFGPE